jgi:hypothetical protein
MYDLFLFGLLVTVGHLAVTYASTEIWRLEYKTYLALNVAVGLLVGIVSKVAAVAWKDRIDQIFKQELADREILIDLLLFIVTIVVGGLISSALVYRRYGLAGWAGAYVTNMVVSGLV